MKNPLLLLFFSLLTLSCSSQKVIAEQSNTLNKEEQEIVNTLQKMFDLMTANDVQGSKELLLEDGAYYVIDAQAKRTRKVTFKKYLKDLEKGGEVLVEKMKNPQVLVQNNIATLLTEYNFFVDDKFSHCGVEIFNFIKIGGKWKISGSIFTIEEENCK